LYKNNQGENSMSRTREIKHESGGDSQSRANTRTREIKHESGPVSPSGTIYEVGERELKVGELIGKGAYGNVYDITYTTHQMGDSPLVIKYFNKKTGLSPEEITKRNNAIIKEAKFNLQYSDIGVLSPDGVQSDYLLIMKKIPPSLHKTFLGKNSDKNCLKIKNQYQLLDLFISIAQELHVLHKKNIVHFDLHAGNIGLDLETGKVGICDFGMAYEIGQQTEGLGLDEANRGEFFQYAPETKESINADPKQDVFSLGMIFMGLYQKYENQLNLPPLMNGMIFQDKPMPRLIGSMLLGEPEQRASLDKIQQQLKQIKYQKQISLQPLLKLVIEDRDRYSAKKQNRFFLAKQPDKDNPRYKKLEELRELIEDVEKSLKNSLDIDGGVLFNQIQKKINELEALVKQESFFGARFTNPASLIAVNKMREMIDGIQNNKAQRYDSQSPTREVLSHRQAKHS
jgi:serine/threonine protein kinase